jgi:hypothetical protein
MQGAADRAGADAAAAAAPAGHVAWVWVGGEAVLIRGMLRALHGHCLAELPRGWTALERTACHLRCARARAQSCLIRRPSSPHMR